MQFLVIGKRRDCDHLMFRTVNRCETLPTLPQHRIKSTQQLSQLSHIPKPSNFGTEPLHQSSAIRAFSHLGLIQAACRSPAMAIQHPTIRYNRHGTYLRYYSTAVVARGFVVSLTQVHISAPKSAVIRPNPTRFSKSVAQPCGFNLDFSLTADTYRLHPPLLYPQVKPPRPHSQLYTRWWSQYTQQGRQAEMLAPL